jgi:hypothetical protein
MALQSATVAKWLSLFPALEQVNVLLPYDVPEEEQDRLVSAYENHLQKAMPHILKENLIVLTF